VQLKSRMPTSVDRREVLFVGSGLGAFAGSDAGFAYALVGDLHGVRHLLGGGSSEGAKETGYIDSAVAHLGVDGSVHRGEEFVAKLVEDAIDVKVRHTLTITELWEDSRAESWNGYTASHSQRRN